MSHNLGRIVPQNNTLNESTGIDFIPDPGPLGGPRFVILHFDNVNLSGSAKLTVDLGYDTDIFTKNSGSSFWSRPFRRFSSGRAQNSELADAGGCQVGHNRHTAPDFRS